MTGGFDISGAAAKALAEELDTIAGAVSRPVLQWVGQAGEAHAEALGQMATSIRGATDDLMTAASSAEGQVGADAALAAAPTPDEVEAARVALEQAKIAAMAGNLTDMELMAAAAEYQRIKGEREAALEAHTDATTQCEIPNSGVCTPGGGIPRGEGPDTKDGTAADTGEGGIAQGEGRDDEVVARGADGSSVDELPGEGESPSTSTDTGDVTPTANTGSPSVSPAASTPSLSDTAAPANTSLSTDGGATLSPQAGSLGATPMQQAPQPGVSSPPPAGGAVTGAGSMLGAAQQQQPQRRGGGSGFGQQNDRNDKTDNGGKLSESSMSAILSGGSAVVGGATVGAAAAGMSPATAPSSAAPTPAAPAAPATPAAPGGTPAGGGVAPMGAMGSGNRPAGGQPVAPKPEPPKVNPDLMSRVDDLLKGGDSKPPTDDTKKAS